MAPEESPSPPRSALERALAFVTEVKAGEGPTALLLTVNIFLLLTAYYVIKPVREALILAMDSGAEYKSYMSAVIAVLLLVAVPAYSRVANRLPRNRLVVGVTLFFTSHLALFFIGSGVDVVQKNLGLVFYAWVGIFNMMVVAQFWAFANDLYTEEQGKRLFALIGIGASVGAAVGSGFAAILVEAVGTFPMLVVAGAFLVVNALLTQVIHVRETRRAASAALAEATPVENEAPKEKAQAFRMVFRHRYLILLAIFHLLFTFVNTNGEYMLGKLVSAEAAEFVSDGTGNGSKSDFIASFYSQFFFYVNVLGVLIQTFLVSRLVKYLGLPVTFYILPVVALLDATAIAIVPALYILRIGKTAENATDYSINNTVRHMLWLPTTGEMKYHAKQAVDTFFVRMGDVGSAILVYVGTTMLDWSVRGFAVSNIALVLLWMVVAGAILRENKRLSAVAVKNAAVAT